MEKYIYKFPIGDWSNDGHGKCEYFIVNAEKPIEDIKKAHKECKVVFGFSPGEICHHYEENTLKPSMYISLMDIFGKLDFEEDESLEPEDVLKLWLKMLNHVDDNLKLVLDENVIDINNWTCGVDTPGYGCFS